MYFIYAVMFSLTHNSFLVGFSKPMVFTTASAMFLMIYLALWKFNNNYNVILLSSTSSSSSSSATPSLNSTEFAVFLESANITEDVLFCNSFTPRQVCNAQKCNVNYFI